MRNRKKIGVVPNMHLFLNLKDHIGHRLEKRFLESDQIHQKIEGNQDF